MTKIFDKENGTIHIHTSGTLLDATVLQVAIEISAKLLETRCNNMTKTILFICEPKENYSEKLLIDVIDVVKLALEETINETN